LLLVSAITICLLPFINKAFNIDDPLFIWAAKNIQSKPFDPYGFTVNWYGTDESMSSVTKNPPLASYYIALTGSLFGWSETALHCAFLFPALIVAIGTYLIAQRYCRSPLIAAFSSVLTPVYFVSSLTVMSDIMMLAFWVFAIYFWINGIENKSHTSSALASVLIALSALTKYFGMMLIPLLFFYTIFKERRINRQLLYILIPIIILTWYQWVTQRLYGKGLLFDAASYATDTGTLLSNFSASKAYISFAFTGGCIASVLFFARQMWSRLAINIGLACILITACAIFFFKLFGSFPLLVNDFARFLLAVQLGIWGTVGISLIVLSTLDLFHRKDADSLLLFFWIIGTFIFAGFINWTINGRSILPMIVPAGILIARRTEQRQLPEKQRRFSASVVPLVASALVSLVVTWADFKLANTARQGATKICERYKDRKMPIWFQGHWGYQYYMEQLGAKAIDITHIQCTQGDIIALPTINTSIHRMPYERISFREAIYIPSTSWLSTMNPDIGAGFYSSYFGPVPFAFGSVNGELFLIYNVEHQ
jgi:4-amino-4-deoxy-L-arabinose transferase-like glycosyltransferase